MLTVIDWLVIIIKVAYQANVRVMLQDNFWVCKIFEAILLTLSHLQDMSRFHDKLFSTVSHYNRKIVYIHLYEDENS